MITTIEGNADSVVRGRRLDLIDPTEVSTIVFIVRLGPRRSPLIIAPHVATPSQPVCNPIKSTNDGRLEWVYPPQMPTLTRFRSTAPLITLVLLACPTTLPPDQGPPTGDGLFSEGCPIALQALARTIGVDAQLPGATAVGTRGDVLLANEHAAFVITAPDKDATYYYYDGIVADAAPMSGCTVIGDDKLDEVGLVMGELSLVNIDDSVLRAFRGESMEILSDGSGGSAAVVRVTGVDDTHWLVEYTLISDAINRGGREVSQPYNIEIVVDYVLEPDSPVLRIDVRYNNLNDEALTLFGGTLLSFAPTMASHAFSSGTIGIPGINLDFGTPWIVATDGEGALAYGVEAGNLAFTSIGGMSIAVDITQVLGDPLVISAGGYQVRTTFLSVGAGGGPTATTPYLVSNPEPVVGQFFDAVTKTGKVVDAAGNGVANASVRLEASTEDAGWDTLDQTWTDASGNFELVVPVDSVAPWSFRLAASADGRDTPEPVEINNEPGSVELTVPALGTVDYAFTDDNGDGPAKLVLERVDGHTVTDWLIGTGSRPVAPGDYSWTATRGYEFGVVTGEVTVPEDGSASVTADMVRLIDTTGYMTVDTHVHTAGSPDSNTLPEHALVRAAGQGLEIVMHTEHEYIGDYSAVPAEVGVHAWVNNINGMEMTATMPEHMTVFPVESDGSIRGGIVEWYSKDIAEILADMRIRSDNGVSLINHPGYVSRIGWDRVSAEPTLTDATLLGLEAGSAIWDWNFDGLEVMNGHASPFASHGNGRFDDWMSMVNAGFPSIGVGCSDDHGGRGIGRPYSYYASPTDDPLQMQDADIVIAFLGGQVMASTGAFARVTVNDAGLGETVTDLDGQVDLWVHVEALPEVDVTHVVVFANCDEVRVIDATDPDGVIKLDTTVTVDVPVDTQIVVAAFGAERFPAGLSDFNPEGVPRVLTNPIYVDADDNGTFDGAAGRECSYTLGYSAEE